MAQIPLTPEFLLKIISRSEKEYGQTALSNFALDLLLDEANGEIARLRENIINLEEQNRALHTRCRQADADNETLREQLDEKRKGRFRGADKT